MITFRQHLEISKTLGNKDGLLEFIDKLKPEDKIALTRDMTTVYPLNMSWNSGYSIHKNFNVYTDPMDLVLGQFIMIEQITTGKMNFETEAENDLALAELILRPKHQREFDNEDTETEIKNRNNILDCCVTEVYSILNAFLKKREHILFKQFAGVFYEPSEDDDEEEDGTVNNESLFMQQWYWYSMVRMLAKEDITRYGEIYMLKMSTVMPEMSYLAQKNKIESANQRQQQALSKL